MDYGSIESVPGCGPAEARREGLGDYVERILVTGAAGFIGSHLVETLLARGHEVTAVVRRTSRNQASFDLPNLRAVTDDKHLSVLTVDLAGPSAVEVLADRRETVWMHLAADAYVPASFTQASSVVLNNVMTTVNVLEAARRAEPRTVLVMSSSEVYGSHRTPISEHMPLEPSTPYAASKLSAEKVAQSYFSTYGTPVAIARPFNCYGPRHTYDVVPLFLSKALRNEPLIINGDGNQTRDLTYVDDTVDALIRMISTPRLGVPINIGTGVDHSINTIAQKVLEVTGSSSEILHAAARLGEVTRLCSDPSLAAAELGWKAEVDLDEGLVRNAEWMRGRP
jgi:NDP-hexose 4,6-dehydratase